MTAVRSLPESRVPGSRDAPALRWGIMGPGWIADRFTESVQAHTNQVIAAVGSRSLTRSEAFAARHSVAAAYGSYEELAASDVIRHVLDAGMLGDITTVFAEYGEHFDPDHRIFDPALAGGPLLDLGTYPLSLITSILGEPQTVLALGQPHASGVNGQISAVMAFPGGRQAVMNTQLHNFTPTAATITGTDATLSIDGPFNFPGGFTVRYPDGTRLSYEEPGGGHFAGLHFEAAAVARAIAAGEHEAAQRPLSASILTLAAADTIRGQLGLVFPGEATPPSTSAGGSPSVSEKERAS